MPDVAEVATIGGMVRQYQVVLDPDKLAAYRIPHARVVEAIHRATRRPAARCWSWARPSSWCAPPATCRRWTISRHSAATTDAGVSVRLADVARIQLGRRCGAASASLDGEGEAVGG